MVKRRKKRSRNTPPRKQGGATQRIGRAQPHGELANESVHIFVDDQNLFYGIVNAGDGPGFRIDFGLLSLAAAKATDGRTRGIASACAAGVIPDDDSFWKVVENQGFRVRRGFIGAGQKSKQDDAHLITEMITAVYEEPGPSTVVLVAGDADYAPPLQAALRKGWRTEVAFIGRGVSASLEPCAHEIREFSPSSIKFIRD